MGHIRRQAILSSIVIYAGFFIGFLNTYLFIRDNTFTTEQYGLTRLIGDIGITLFSFSSLGVLSYIYKFFPYYKSNLKKGESDQLAWTLCLACAGFLIVGLATWYFRPFMQRKFSERSALLVDYYYWVLPYAFGYLLFAIFEAFAWFARKSVFTNFLKETAFRIFQTILLALYLFRVISFPLFIKLFSCSYLVILIPLLIRLWRTGDFGLNFKVSTVTRRLGPKIAPFLLFIYGSQIISTVAQYIDSIVIAGISKKGLADAGVFTLASFIANTIQVPQRSIVAATIPVLSHSWRSKDLREIDRIYRRSSINLLLIGLLIFALIWMNVDDLFNVLHVNKAYKVGYNVIFLLGISRVVDAGTGLNGQIIGTSNYWRFDVLTGVVLLALMFPLNYFLIKAYGITGSALANLVSFTVYNGLRVWFIWWKYKMQPFNWKSLYSILVAAGIYCICQLLFGSMDGIPAMLLRSALFTALFVGAVFWMRLTPDAHQLVELARNKVKNFRNRR